MLTTMFLMGLLYAGFAFVLFSLGAGVGVMVVFCAGLLLAQVFLSDKIALASMGAKEVTPEQAEQVSPDAVARVAEHAEQRDPSVVDQLSDIYSRNPTLIKVLGTAALGIALSQIAKRRQ